MKKHCVLTLLLFCLLIFSCNNTTKLDKNEKKSINKKTSTLKQKSKSVSSILLGSRYDSIIRTETAVDFLTDFGKKNPENKVVISTSFGNVFIQLFDDTPLHRAAFIYLVKKQYFDETLFYRISKNFVIQGGNTNDKSALEKRKKIGGFYIPQEFSNHKHVIGSLAAAKEYEDNPNDYSNPYNFYIIVGQKHNNKTLNRLELMYNLKLSLSDRKTYSKNGGAPHLDGKHTVFGKVYKGMDVVEKINQLPVDASEWPLDDVKMKVTLIK
jgi:peptidyl-prolyl cis-trans isomerase A (cyclophilin A)